MRLIAPYKGLWAGATIALLAAGLVNLSLPQLVRVAIDDALVASDPEALKEILLVAVGIFYVLLALRRADPSSSGASWLETSGAFLMFGYIMRFLSEGYAAIKPAVLRLDLRHEESAQTLGASPMRIFQSITLPALSPGLVAGYTLLFIAIAKELPITLMLTPLGEQTLAYRIFDAQQEGALPDAGLSALILMVLALSVQLLLSKGWKHD